jgi:hypothetical protein
MGIVEGETGSCSDTCPTGGDDGIGEGSIQVKETIAIKDEIPEAIKFPAIKTEYEVRLQGVHEMIPAHVVRPFIALKRKL